LIYCILATTFCAFIEEDYANCLSTSSLGCKEIQEEYQCGLIVPQVIIVNARSMVLAATVTTHGAVFINCMGIWTGIPRRAYYRNSFSYSMKGTNSCCFLNVGSKWRW
jgi:hypothetical protein